MRCPQCHSTSRVYGTFQQGAARLRYRRCTMCGHKWRSVEEKTPGEVSSYSPRKQNDDLFGEAG